MGNRSSSASKQTQNGINGKLRSMNGALPAQDNDISNRTQYDRGVDQRPRLNLRTYRSFSPADQVARLTFKKLLLTVSARNCICLCCCDFLSYYSAAALLAMQSAVLATAITSVRPSVTLWYLSLIHI